MLGPHGLQIDTLSDNESMSRAARRAGFTVGALQSWGPPTGSLATGAFTDETVLGLLAHDHT